MELISGLVGGFGLGIIVWELLNRKRMIQMTEHATRAIELAEHLMNDDEFVLTEMGQKTADRITES